MNKILASPEALLSQIERACEEGRILDASHLEDQMLDHLEAGGRFPASLLSPWAARRVPYLAEVFGQPVAMPVMSEWFPANHYNRMI